MVKGGQSEKLLRKFTTDSRAGRGGGEAPPSRQGLAGIDGDGPQQVLVQQLLVRQVLVQQVLVQQLRVQQVLVQCSVPIWV